MKFRLALDPFRFSAAVRSTSRIQQSLALFAFAASTAVQAQTASVSHVPAPIPQTDRVPASPDFGLKTQLAGHVPAWANTSAEVSSHAVEASTPWRISITLRRDPAVQAAFDQLLTDQQTPASPMYHQWLTAQQIGDIYGPTQHDVDAVAGWLTSQGLKVIDVAPSRMLIDADGTAGTVGGAFQTGFAYYMLGQKEQRSAVKEPSVPAALAPVIMVIGGMTDIVSEALSHMEKLPTPNRYETPVTGVGGISPDYTSNATTYYLAAGDFNVIYDLASVVSGGNTGAKIGTTTQNIAIIGRSEVTAADITSYMNSYGANGETTYNLTQTPVPAGSGGSNPGITYTADTNEATLDVQRVVGTANGAQANLVVSASTTIDGVTIALDYNVNTLMFPVMTISFGACEYNEGSANTTALDTTFAQAAAEGIATFVSAGDSLAAGCDQAFTTPPATQVKSPNYLCASSHVTCVGGTEFNDASSYATYWNSTNSTGYESAKSYIPEGAWNETGSASPYQVAGTGGGISSVIVKPTYQTGTGVPADGYRDTPDVAFTAANHDGYLGVYTPSSGGAQGTYDFSGTSAAAPGMAAIDALINTKLGFDEGPLNPLIYKLAATNASSFHDVTISSSGVSGCTSATPSMCNNSTAGSSTSLSGGIAGYDVTAGYDQATGWGSLDVANFLTAAIASNLTVSSAHTGNFTAGGTGYTYTLTVKNSGGTATSGTISVVDTLPSGFTATALSGTGWTCTLGTLTCTQTAALAANTSANAITLTVSVSSAETPGTYNNGVTVSLGGTLADTAIDPTLVVAATAAATLTESFSPTAIAVGGSSTGTYTFSNPNTGVTLTGVTFSDTLPTGVANSSETSYICTNGSTSPALNPFTSSTFTITGASLAANGSCVLKLAVTGSAAGQYVNTTSTITATSAPTGSAASATLIVGAELTVTSTHTGNFKAADTGDTYTLTASDNASSIATNGTVTVTDTLPTGFSATAMSGTGWTCTVASVKCTRSDALAAGSSYPAITLTVSVSSTDIGTYTNSVAISGGNGFSPGAGTDPTIVVGQPTITKTFTPSTVAPNAASTVTITLGNPAANPVTLSGVGFTDMLPTGMKVFTPNGASTNCSGAVLMATAGTSSGSLTGASIAPGTTCTAVINVSAAAIGSYLNTTSVVTSTTSNPGGTASATLTVAVTPTKLVYTASPATPIAVGGNAGTISVALEDAAGNIATNNSSTSLTVAVTGPSGYSQNYVATTLNGVASYNLSTIPLTVAGIYTYVATATGYTSASAPEVVNPGSAASAVVTGLGPFAYPGVAGTATVTLIDSYGNTATGFTGTVSLTSTDSSATLPAAYNYVAADAGSHAFAVTLNTAGTWTVTATSGAITGSETGIVVDDSIWLLNANSQVVKLSDAGTQVTSAGTSGSNGMFGGIAFDKAGDVWATQQGQGTVVEYSKTGTLLRTVASGTGGLYEPASLAIDGLGQIWVVDPNNEVTVLSSAGAAVSPSTGYLNGKLNQPFALVIDNSGSVWITNSTTVTKIIGAAAPVATPAVSGTINHTLGTEP